MGKIYLFSVIRMLDFTKLNPYIINDRRVKRVVRYIQEVDNGQTLKDTEAILTGWYERQFSPGYTQADAECQVWYIY